MRVRWANISIALMLAVGATWAWLHRDRIVRVVDNLIWSVRSEEQWKPVLWALGIGLVFLTVARLRHAMRRSDGGQRGDHEQKR